MIAVTTVSLPEPRPLTETERELLDFLLSGPVDSSELRAQADTATVWGTCSCGCASVSLRVPDDAPRGTLTGPEVLPSGGAEIRASGINDDGEEIDVTLHVWTLNEDYDVRKGGAVLGEMEVWPTSRPLRVGEDETAWFGYKKPPRVPGLRFTTDT